MLAMFQFFLVFFFGWHICIHMLVRLDPHHGPCFHSIHDILSMMPVKLLLGGVGGGVLNNI